MTSPAINNGNGQKENSKSDSNVTLNQTQRAAEEQQQEAERNTPPLTAWWRIFKLVDLLMQPNC